MHDDDGVPPSRLSDSELVAQLLELARCERENLAQLVLHLGELDVRKLYVKAGYGSLFVYCREVLLLSEHDAYNRIDVARASRCLPRIIGLLEEGAVTLTSVRLLAPHLTPENHEALLASVRGKRRIEVEEIVVALMPQPDARSWVRKIPTRPLPPPTPEQAAAAPVPPLPSPAIPTRPAPLAAVPPLAPTAPRPFTITPEPPRPLPAPPARPNTTVPLAPERYRLQVTIGVELRDKLQLAKDMLSHAIPSGDEAEILDRALTLLLADLARRRFAATDKPGAARATAEGSRHIPAEVKRTVWVRDLGRCAFVGTGGHRCSERRFLEFHHLKPFAIGGEPTAENIALRCRPHNDYESQVFFAREEIDGSDRLSEARTAYGLPPQFAGDP